MRDRFRSIRRRTPPKGFALVVTMSMLILLMVLAIGLLSLSSISLRTSGQSEASARARANARMALSIAIGELQKHAGADTRVTARADILDESNPPVLGVWKSWEGSNHQTTGPFAGRPISPGNYDAKKRDRFLAWLTSVETTTAPPSTAKGSRTVPLVGENSVGSGGNRETLQIHLEPTEIGQGAGSGSIAWWIGGENQKARLPDIREPTEDTFARWSVHSQSHSTADPAPFRLDELITQPALAENAISLGQTDLIGAAEAGIRGSQEFFHDLSTSSVGLLTNTATGGWRKDMSLATENWNLIGASNLPFFRVEPERDITYAKPTSQNPVAARSMLYPWAAYRGSGADPPIYRHGPVASWENLKDYVTSYKRVMGAGGVSRMNPASYPIDDSNHFNFLHKVRVLPVIARVQWVYSHSAAVTGAGLQPRLLLNPVITIWNPYNVEIPMTPLQFNFPNPLPTALRYTINGTQTPFRSLTNGSTNYGPISTQSSLNYSISTAAPLKPGETRVFSHQSAPVDANTGARLPLTPGFSPTGGHYFVLQSSAPTNTSIDVEVALDTAYNDIAVGVGVYLDMLRQDNRRHLVYRMVYTPELARQVYSNIQGLGGVTASELASTIGNPRPFLTTIFGARMTSNTHLSAKGFVQSSPLVNYTAMGRKDEVEPTISRQYGGTRHPVNSPFDFSFEALSAAGSDVLPNVGDGNSGYIVTGFTSGTGVSRCVVAGIPLRPIASLAELQHWDLRYENPIPPYAFNIIGNSDATPLLPSNAVTNPGDSPLPVNLQHDDFYCANHLLFDDWFLSSIAPNPNTFGPAGPSLQDTYSDFIEGKEPLANRAYRPIAEDTATDNPQSLYSQNVGNGAAWRKIASRFEVEGMFNVNSTSVTAWRALLGHARNQKIPYIESSGNTWDVALSEPTDYAFTRTNVAGDTRASNASFGDTDPEIGGYQVFDEQILDRLAEEIVIQVRLRGPFLSLAEFVNRQLSTGELALAGAIQTALNKLSADAGSNPYQTVQDLSSPSLAQPPGHPAQAYKFPEAAIGYGAYGVPGWTRQADVLRPLAPILSARDDTFTIRAYGDARDASGRILARATCEAVVRRTRDFVDAADAADTITPLTSETNRTFGRRFQLVSFRWLHDSEI